MPDRPNLLVVLTDQQYAGALGCAGNDWLDTPNVDRLAERGTRFENAYCANPLCAPSRVAMLTGQPSHVNGVTDNGGELAEDVAGRMLDDVFDAAGYDCGYGGKWHAPEPLGGTPADSAFEELCGFDDDALPDAIAEFVGRDRDDPFLAVASFDNPHNVCEFSRDQLLPWGPVADVPREEYPPLPPNYHPPPYEPVRIRQELDEHYALQAMAGAGPEEWRRYRHGYYRLIERVDEGIGRILDALADAGHAEDTVVVFASDHGDGHGAHQLLQKSFLYEEQVRVPLIVSAPGEADAGRVDDSLVNVGLDVLPTLCDYAGVDPPGDLPGYSLRGPARGESPDDWRDRVVVQTFDRVEGRLVRTDQYKYVVYAQGRRREQLFDLEADPGEMVDLTVQAASDDVLGAHREALLEWCLETGDTFGEHYAHPGVPGVPGHEYAEVAERMGDRD